MKKPEPFTLMVIPHRGKKPYSLRINYLNVVLLAGIMAAALVGTSFYFLGTQQKANLRGKLKKLEAVKIDQDRQIKEMGQILDELKAFGRKVKTLTGINEGQSLIKDAGGQGGPVLKWPMEEFFTGEQKIIPAEWRDIEDLKEEIYLERQNFRELIEKMEEREELFVCTPTICPVNGAYISSEYGWRCRPRKEFHYGLDLVARRGTSVRAAAAGRVNFVGWQGGYGNKVQINHGYGYKTVYAHLDRIKVRWGEFVKKGQVIGTLGNTGRSTGPHLHYEVHDKGKKVNPLDYILVKLK